MGIFVSDTAMTGERTQMALARIEAALARLEKVGEPIESAARSAAERHDRLKAAVTETLRDLDRLIGNAAP